MFHNLGPTVTHFPVSGYLGVLEQPVLLHGVGADQCLILVVEPDLVSQHRVERVEVVVGEPAAVDEYDPATLGDGRRLDVAHGRGSSHYGQSEQPPSCQNKTFSQH